MKGCVISAVMTGAGKTTVTLGILSALRRRGVAVQPFKVGPDFIDSGLHEIASGKPSHNLDGWMLTREANEWLFEKACTGMDIAIVEGVMGLYDGFDGKSERGSTAEMAKWLELPVVLVIDAYPMARSVAALVQGFRHFDPEVKIAGVIFNRVGGEGHYRILADAVGNLPILGWLPIDPEIEIKERHLGLLTVGEVTEERIQALGAFLESHIDIQKLLTGTCERPPAAPGAAVPLSRGTMHSSPAASGGAAVPLGRGTMLSPPEKGESRASFLRLRLSARASPRGRGSLTQPVAFHKVALAQDKAFSFYYHANRMALEEAGAEIVEFSPLADRELPAADFLYIGGGYPELYRKELEENTSMRASIRRFIESGGRFYAECGGLMYLSKAIEDSRMVGVIPVEIQMTGHLVDFGYCEVSTNTKSILGPLATAARGHQFHYSQSIPSGGAAYCVTQGERQYHEGFIFENGLASYIHLHFLSNPALARNMLNS